jgi:hypothetical protein
MISAAVQRPWTLSYSYILSRNILSFSKSSAFRHNAPKLDSCSIARPHRHHSDANSRYLQLFPGDPILYAGRALTNFQSAILDLGETRSTKWKGTVQDESSGSPKQDRQLATPESHSPEGQQASPTNGNGHSPGDHTQSEEASPKAASHAGPSVASSADPDGNDSVETKTESDERQLSTHRSNGNGALEPPEHAPNAVISGCSEAPAADQEPDLEEKGLGREGRREAGQEQEEVEEEYVPRFQYTTEESLRDTTPMLDLVRVHSPTSSSVNVCLIEWEGSTPKITTVNHGVQVDGYYKKVPSFPEGLKRSLLLPTALAPYEDTRDLFGSIHSRLQGWVRLSETQAALLTYWSLATWFPEYLNFVPRLTITGPRLAADSLLQALHSVCCKPIPLASIGPAALRTIPFSEFIPTLLIRSSRLTKAALEFLDASDGKGYFVANGNDLQKSQTVKCIYFGEEFKQPAFTLDGIHIHLASNAFLPNSCIPSMNEVQTLQNQLFFYRVYNRRLVQNSGFRVWKLIPHLCAVAQQLGAVVPDDKTLQNRVIDLLASRNEQSCTDRAFALNGLVLRAVLYHCHQPDREKVFVREIATTVNTMCKDLGEPMKFSNEAVGCALKSIGLYTRRLGSTGRGLILDNVTRREAHELSRMNEVIPDDTEPSACNYCGGPGTAADAPM